MRWCLCIMAMLLITGTVCRGDEQPNYEQLKKLYDDALKSLENAQNSKNQLSQENEKLKGNVAELGKQLADARSQVDKLREEQAQWAEKSYFYRSYYAAWKTFIGRYPKLQVHWELYLDGKPDPATDRDLWMDMDWPLPRNG